jgi:hypothetical protein
MVSGRAPTDGRTTPGAPTRLSDSRDPPFEDPPRAGVLRRWRDRLPDALPLLLVGAGALLLALLAHTLTGGGPVAGRIPLWTAFTAMGGVVFGGGVTVIVAGGDDRFDEAGLLCDPTARRSVSGWSASSIFAESAYDESSLPRPSVSPDRTKPSASAPSVPSRTGPSVPGSEPRRPEVVEQTIRDVETALDEILESAQHASPPPVRHPKEVGKRPVGAPSPTAVSRSPTAPKGTRSVAPPNRTPPSAPAAMPGRPAEPPNLCLGCGAAIAGTNTTETCTVCGEPLCRNCELQARGAGHPGVCPNCERLLFRSGAPP